MTTIYPPLHHRTPKVNEAKEFMEIASDFGQPLELLREAISNAFDAKATRIRILFSTEVVKGVHVLKIVIEDNGSGMDRDDLQAFFDRLGNSRRHVEKNLAGASLDVTAPIGEKGHGTKVYFNSSRITVMTSHGGKTHKAVLNEPYGSLSDGKIPEVTVEEEVASPDSEFVTKIRIDGYNHNQTELLPTRSFAGLHLLVHEVWFVRRTVRVQDPTRRRASLKGPRSKRDRSAQVRPSIPGRERESARPV